MPGSDMNGAAPPTQAACTTSKRIDKLTPPGHRMRLRALLSLLIGAPAVLLWPGDRHVSHLNRWLLRDEDSRPRHAAFKVERIHLLERLSIQAVEAREVVHDPMGAVPRSPFGHLHPVWLAFKASLVPGDEIWSFDAVWPGGSGGVQKLSGYVRWRNGESRGHVVTRRRPLEDEAMG